MGQIGRLLSQFAQHSLALRLGEAAHIPEVRFRGYRLVDGAPVFVYEIDGVRVEHAIEATEDAVTQTFVLGEVPDKVFFQGSGENPHHSSAGTWRGSLLEVDLAHDGRFFVTTRLSTKEER